MKPNVFDLPYHVTRDGKVYRLKTQGWELRKLKIVTKGNRKSYRIRIHVADKKVDRHFSVSRLVAMIYIPNPHNYPCVCHRDNNPLNNKVSNLYWGTQRMNIQQALRENRLTTLFTSENNPGKGRFGYLNPWSKLTKEQEVEIMELHNKGKSTGYISKKFGVGNECIRRVIKRLSK
jgi:hypothetical protein|nr:hypothetical protein [uncultured Dysosmobacter sp.]